MHILMIHNMLLAPLKMVRLEEQRYSTLCEFAHLSSVVDKGRRTTIFYDMVASLSIMMTTAAVLVTAGGSSIEQKKTVPNLKVVLHVLAAGSARQSRVQSFVAFPIE